MKKAFRVFLFLLAALSCLTAFARHRAAVAEELRIAVLFFCFIRSEPPQQRAPKRGLRIVVRRRVKGADIARVAAFRINGKVLPEIDRLGARVRRLGKHKGA